MTALIVSREGPLVITDERGDGRTYVLTSGLRGPQGPAGSGVTTASASEVLTGTDTSKAVTPDALAALWEKGSDIASAGTISVGEGGFFHITGTTTITDIDPATDKAGRAFWLVFDGVLTLTHNATTLILPTGANITTAAGDTACFVSEGSDAVRCLVYQRASGAASGTQTGEAISGFIASPSNKDYRIVVKIPHGGTITETTTRSASGTCTATFKVNTTALGGTANSVSSSEQSQSHASSNTFAADDDIVLTVSSNSSCADMSFTIKYTRVLA